MLKALSVLSVWTGAYTYCTDNVLVMEHPVKELLLSRIRNAKSGHDVFTANSNRLIRLLLEYTLGHEPVTKTIETTPLGATYEHSELTYLNQYCVVVILRAANSMTGEVTQLLPNVSTGFVLIQRNEGSRDKLPIFFYSKFPKDLADMRILLVDPMVATGGSAITAIRAILEAGGKEENIVFVNLIGFMDAFIRIQTLFPRIKIVTAQVDPTLDENKYILPGLGDFGDRYYNTT